MDDVLKQKLMFAFVAFNLTVVAYQIVFNSDPFSWGNLGIGMLAALFVGGAVFGVTHFLSR